MHIVIDAKLLRNVADRAAVVVGKGGTMPILSSMLISAFASATPPPKVTVNVTNLDVYLSLDIREAHYQEPGAVCIGVRELRKVLRGMSGLVDIQSESDFRVKVGSFTLEGFSPDEFPAVPSNFRSPDRDRIPLSAEVLSKVACAAYPVDEGGRFYVQGVWIDVRGLVATDGHRLHILKGDFPVHLGHDRKDRDPDRPGLFLPRTLLDVFLHSKFRKVYSGEVTYFPQSDEKGKRERGWWAVSLAGGNLIGREGDFDFPSWESVIPPADSLIPLQVDRACFEAACRAVLAVGGDVVLRLNGDGLRIEASGADCGDYFAPLEGIVEGGLDYDRIGLNPKYMLDALGQTSFDPVRIGLPSTNDKAIWIEDGPFKAGVFPKKRV